MRDFEFENAVLFVPENIDSLHDLKIRYDRAGFVKINLCFADGDRWLFKKPTICFFNLDERTHIDLLLFREVFRLSAHPLNRPVRPARGLTKRESENQPDPDDRQADGNED